MDLYDRDFFQWTQRNAELLSQGCLAQADIPHIAEELADMGRSDQREVDSFLRRLMIYLLKWQIQPAKRSASWLSSIADSRVQLEGIFKQSPSLKRYGAESLADIYPSALKLAAIQTRLAQSAFPPECPYSFDQVMDPDFVPEA